MPDHPTEPDIPTRPDRDWVTRLGLIAVGLTAIVWSFTALSDLARLCGVAAVIDLPVEILGVRQLHVAWGLPATVDVLALVATRVWLRGLAPADAVRYARRAAWGAILATIAGNAYHGWLTGQGRIDSIIVSAAPAVVIGVIVHLAVLAGRPHPPTPARHPFDEPDDQDVGVWTVADELAVQEAGDTEADERETARLTYLIRRELIDRTRVIDTSDLGQVMDDLQAGAGGKRGRRFSRDDIANMYAIGKGRARNAQKLLGWGQQADDQADAGEVAAR